MRRYVALIHHDPESGSYGILFPDFPGCISAAESYEAALASGAEALAGHVALMRRDGNPIPEPRAIEEIRKARQDWIDWDGAIVALVPLLAPPGRALRLNISLDEGLVEAIDGAAKKQGQTRSGFLAEAARRALEAI